jgi:hypothetical protein
MNLDIKNIWKSLYRTKNPPRELRQIIIIPSKHFYKVIKNKQHAYEIIKNLYEGDIYIIKEVLDQSYVKNLKKQLINFSNKNPSTFYKMTGKCPNFWRKIDGKNNKKYSLKSNRLAFNFFRWNNDKFKIFNNIDKFWGVTKFLSGKKINEYKYNLPKHGKVDRVQITQYPINTGYIEPHVHALDYDDLNLVVSIYLSELNLDYSYGGTYFYKNNSKINVEYYIKKGDGGLFFPTMIHGVDTVSLSKEIIKIKDSDKSRWWLGPYSPESDEKENRKTSKKIKLNN